MDYVKNNGITWYSDYPYVGYKQKCMPFTPRYKVGGYANVV